MHVNAAAAWLAACLALAQSPPAASPTDRFIDVNGLRLHYLEWGERNKPAFILLHGIGRDAHSFDHIAPYFARDYRVLALDLRGHGDSAWHPDGAYMVEDFVADLAGLVKELGLEDITLLGNSTGGRVAQVYGGLHADNVRALIIEDVGPERPADIASGFARRVKAEANGWSSEEELFEYLKPQSAGVAPELVKAHVRSATRRREDGRLVWKRDPALVKGFVPTDLWQHVSRITAPTLYILGGKSTIVSPATQERLKRTLPRCELVVLPGVGHYPHLEVPALYIEYVKRFLDSQRR